MTPPPTPNGQQMEPENDLRLLRTQLRAELGITDTQEDVALTAEALQTTITKKLHTKTQELATLVNSNAITSSDRDSKLIQYKRELERQTIELQSIEARLHLGGQATTHVSYAAQQANDALKAEQVSEAAEAAESIASSNTPSAPQSDAVDALHAKGQQALSDMNAMESALDTAHLPPEELRHVRHQLRAAEELLSDIQEETGE